MRGTGEYGVSWTARREHCLTERCLDLALDRRLGLGAYVIEADTRGKLDEP